MSAPGPAPRPIPSGPGEILDRLPERYRETFLADYRAAMTAAAAEPSHWPGLVEVLTLWHLRAAAYSSPGYEQARADAAAGVPGIPAEDVIPGWAELVDGPEAAGA